MSDLPHDVARINALTSNARSTWFVLLGVLSFVGVTLLSVEHIDFYGVDRATQLPLVNVEIPTRFFFFAAPPLVAAVFGYFHLYLIRLWDALSVAEPRVGEDRLGDVITPWLISDAFLFLRNWARKDYCCTHRPLEGTAMILNFLLAWAFGLVVLGGLWWQSMTARQLEMTAVAGASFGMASLVGSASAFILWSRARREADGKKVKFTKTVPVVTAIILGTLLIAEISYGRTKGPKERLAPIDMTGEAIVQRPAGWLPYSVAKAEHLDEWCKRKANSVCVASSAFEQDWKARRTAARADMKRPRWSARKSNDDLNLKAANLSSAFLVGVNLKDAQMAEIVLDGAILESANLVRADLEGAILERALMDSANLFRANLDGANLFQARMVNSNLFSAQMRMINLSGASMERAKLTRAQLQGANLSFANLEHTDFSWTNLSGATLSGSRFFGSDDRVLRLKSTNLSAVTNVSGALRFLDTTDAIWDEHTDFRNVFLDDTVKRSNEFRTRMGNPCQWVKVKLSEKEFFSIWRWWLEKFGTPQNLLLEDLRNAPLPTAARLEELDLTDCEPNQPFGPMPDAN